MLSLVAVSILCFSHNDFKVGPEGMLTVTQEAFVSQFESHVSAIVL